MAPEARHRRQASRPAPNDRADRSMICTSPSAADAAFFLPLLADGQPLWLLLLIVLGSAIVDWFKKRAASANPDSSPEKPAPRSQAKSVPPPSTSTPSPPVTNWEEELRKLLGVEQPPPKPTPAPPPPPLVPRTIDVRPKPPPPLVVVPAVPDRRPAPLAKIDPQFLEARRVATVQLPDLRESSTTYLQASRMPDQVTDQLKKVDQQTEQHLVRAVPTLSRFNPIEVSSVVSLLRRPETARQGIIASVILAPPKGLGLE